MRDLVERFNELIDVDQLREDLREASGTERFVRKEVPHGIYAVMIERLYLRESSNGNPMVTIHFKVVGGEYDRQMIFANQVISNQFGLQKMNTLLTQMKTEIPIKYENNDQYGTLVEEIERTVVGEYVFQLDYSAQVSDPNWSDFNILVSGTSMEDVV